MDSEGNYSKVDSNSRTDSRTTTNSMDLHRDINIGYVICEVRILKLDK